MAVELAVGYVSVVPSARGFGRSLTRLGTSAGGAAGSAASTSFGSRFVGGMASVARRASLAFTAGLGTAGFFAIKTAANFEQTRIAFEGILGDVEKANSLLSDLRDFAAVTPFEFTDLSTAARQLLAVGTASEDIIPTMTILGNVAATLGAGKVEIEGTVRALGQMKGKGRTSAEELRQISEQLPGFSAIGAIAEGLGVSIADAFKLVEDGAVSGDEGIRLILEGMESFPGAAGAMERQSKTLNGVISTFKDTLATTAIDFITPYLPTLSSGVTAFGGFVQTAADGLKDFIYFFNNDFDESPRNAMERLGLVAGEVFPRIVGAIQGLVTDGFQAILGFWDRNGEAIMQWLSDFGETAGGVLSTIGDFIWQTVIPALETFGSWFFEDGPGVQIVIAGLAGAFAIYAANAALAAVATLLAIAPLVVFAVVVGLATWATQKLIDKFDLLPKASKVFQWVIDNAVVPLMRAMERLVAMVEDAWELLANPPSLTDIIPGAGNTAFSDEEIARAERAARGAQPGGTRSAEGSAYVAPAPAPAGGALIGSLTVNPQPGEDPVTTAFREARRTSLLAGT